MIVERHGLLYIFGIGITRALEICRQVFRIQRGDVRVCGSDKITCLCSGVREGVAPAREGGSMLPPSWWRSVES